MVKLSVSTYWQRREGHPEKTTCFCYNCYSRLYSRFGHRKHNPFSSRCYRLRFRFGRPGEEPSSKNWAHPDCTGRSGGPLRLPARFYPLATAPEDLTPSPAAGLENHISWGGGSLEGLNGPARQRSLFVQGNLESPGRFARKKMSRPKKHRGGQTGEEDNPGQKGRKGPAAVPAGRTEYGMVEVK